MSSQEPFDLEEVPPVMHSGTATDALGGNAVDPLRTTAGEMAYKPRVWPTYVSFVIVMIVSVGVGVLLAVGFAIWNVTMVRTGAPTEGLAEWMSTPSMLVVMAVLQGAVLVGASWIGGKFSSMGVRMRLNLAAPRMPWWLIGVGSVGAVGFSICFSAIGEWMHWRSDALQTIDNSIKSPEGPGFLILLAVGVLAPLCEELYFRGYVQSRLAVRHGPLIGIGLASLFFGILHMDVQHSLFATGFGVYLGILAWKSKSVFPAMIAHGLNNLFSVLGSWYLPEMGHTGTTVFNLTAGVVCVAGLVLLGFWKTPAAEEPAVSAAF